MDYGIGHERLLELFKSRSGEEVTGTQIKDEVLKKYPGLARASISPSDHDDDKNLGQCECAKQRDGLFKRLGWNRYLVR